MLKAVNKVSYCGQRVGFSPVESSFFGAISDFRREYEICAVLGYYLVHSGNSLPTFRDNL
jgi:hypothetical protein